MQIEELRKLCDKQDEYKLEYLVLQMPAPKSWLKGSYPGERVRTPFGLCRWYGGYNTNMIVINPTVTQVRKYIKRAENELLWQVVVNKSEGWVGIAKFTLKTPYELKPNEVLIGKVFLSATEALKAVSWAVEQIKKEEKNE